MKAPSGKQRPGRVGVRASAREPALGLTLVRKMQSSLKGSSRLASWIFLMTRTLLGGLFQVSLWLAGS